MTGSWRALVILIVVILHSLEVTAYADGRPEPNSDGDRPSVEDFAWLAGSWIGKPVRLEAGRKGETNRPVDPVAEQTWSAPEAGVMMGMFRLVDGGKTLVLEFMTLRDTPDGVEMKVRHFTSSLENWEDEPISLRLIRYDGTVAEFENPVHDRPKRSFLTREGEHVFESRSEVWNEKGEVAVIQLPMSRAGSEEERDSSPGTTGRSANAIGDTLRFLYQDAKRNTLQSAEVMPDNDYDFRPSAGARSIREMSAI